MRTIVHLSDLHFGKVEYKRVEPLLGLIAKIDPDMVVISGDFTQRAKEKEFIEAQEFIKKIGKPLFVVPGNHDIPLYNAFKRFKSPFKNYTTFISPDLAPIYTDKEIALIGINSVRRFTISSGRISKKQIKEIEEYIKGLHPDLIKIAVCHHPFDLPISKKTHHNHTHKVVAHSKMAIERLSKHKVDVFLSGHLHLHHIGDTTIRYKIEGYRGLIVQAGTAISKRRRGEPVSFNVLKIDDPHMTIDTYSGNDIDCEFSLASSELFIKNKEGWKKAA